MSLSPQTLSEEDLNLLRNDRVKFECGPLVYQAIIEWGFKKPDGVKIIHHFENQKIEEKSGIKLGPWLKKNKKILEKDNFSSLDVTSLHDLLPVLCYSEVCQTGGNAWEAKLKDTNSIEYLLKEIKNYRNDVSHDYSIAKENPNIEAKNEMMRKCIRIAGTLYGKDQSEIDAKVADLDAKFDELVHGTSSYNDAVKHVTELIEKESAPFMLERYSPFFNVPLPSGLGNIQSPDIFQSVNLSVADEDKDKTNTVIDSTDKPKDNAKKEKNVFNSTDICNHVNNNFVVINGGPGSGKTTLMRNLFQNILDNSVNESKLSYKGIERFKVPIYIECRTERQNNLRDFLKESIPNFKSPNEVIYDSFKEVTGKIFLIDGYDEVNDRSRELVKDAIDFCSKYNTTCIVSGRVDAGNNFISTLKERNLSYIEMLIEHISKMSDKLTFLLKYGDKMGDHVDSGELVKSFENLNDAAQKVFFSPVHLALFISLFLNNRNSLFQLHNEQSTYKAITEMFSKEIEKKLSENYVPNPKGRTRDILGVFSYCSLMLFNSEKYFFEENDYENLVEKCEQELSRDVDIKGLLTCILTPETSLKLGKTLTYAFTHSTIQEYLAVEQINKNMRECKIDWNSEQHSEDNLRRNFLKCVGVSTTRNDVERYGNIIKFLILETLSNKELSKITKTFSAVLKDSFGPKFYYDSPHYLLDLVYSSNCDSAIVSIVSNVLRDNSYYCISDCDLHYIRPLTEILNNKELLMTSRVVILLNCSVFLSDTTLANLGQLVSVLKYNSEIMLHFNHSYDNYQPLTEEFYTQLKNSKCKVTKFIACVTSSEHLSIVMRAYRGDFSKGEKLYISTKSVCDVSFVPLQGYGGILYLKVKYTDDGTGNNTVPGIIDLTITDIPADGRDNVYQILKYLSPRSKEFRNIELVKCHLTDTDAIELLRKLMEDDIKTKWTERTKVIRRRVNEDKSRDLRFHMPDIEELICAEQEHLCSLRIEQQKQQEEEIKKQEVEQLHAELIQLAEQRYAEQREAEVLAVRRQYVQKFLNYIVPLVCIVIGFALMIRVLETFFTH